MASFRVDLQILLSLLSGALLALSFPHHGHPAVGWVALAPLFVVCVQLGARPRGAVPGLRPFLLGLLCGLGYFAGTLYWLTAVMRTYGGLGLVPAVGAHLVLLAYLALFPAVAAWVATALVAAYGLAGLFMTPAAWVATELARAHLFGGFPWVLLGYSQSGNLPVAQLASLAGVYGVSGLVALVNAAVASIGTFHGRPRSVGVGVVAAVLLASTLWGVWRIRAGELTRVGTPVRVALVQGNIAQDDKWNPALAGRILRRYVSMSREAARTGATLIIWPESSLPFFFEDDPVAAASVRELARDTGVHLLFGSDQREPAPAGDQPSAGSRGWRYYNSAFMLDEAGRTVGVYRKIHLVPFGEYVPLKRLLYFVRPLVEAVSDFSAGTTAAMLPFEGHRISTAICYEVVYPRLIRTMVLEGSELLTTVTNDAWYGRSSAPHQHFWQAAMRAIEQGRYLARAANTGISGIVDPYGRATVMSDIFVEEVLVGEVRLLQGRTAYARTGDLFAYLCCALTVVALLARRWVVS